MAQNIPNLQSTLIQIPGLEIGEEVGQGAESVVYRAQRNNQQVALKLRRMTDAAQAAEASIRIRREAAFVARLQHSGLAKIWEVGESQSRPFIIMEFIEGLTLSEVIAQNGPLKENDIIALARAIAGALNEAHRFGLVHRDVKPQNILFPSPQKAKLIDFGFAQQATDEAQSNQIVGTLLYSAPEQTGILKRPVDGRADLYALGIVLYESATGAPPFYSKDIGELLRQHAVVVPPNVREKNPNISLALAAIITKLMSKDPDDRYQTGQSLVDDLEQISVINLQARAAKDLALGRLHAQADLLYEIPLIGRELELERLQRIWKKTQKGQGSIVLVEGLPGTGKSRLVRELLNNARRDNSLILSGKCELSDPMPFAPLRKAIEGYLRQIRLMPPEDRRQTELQVKAIAGDYAPMLRRFSTHLAALLNDVKAPAESGDKPDAFYYALANFLMQIAQKDQATVLCIDDVQWLDDASNQVLKIINNEFKEKPFLIAATARNDELSIKNLNRFVDDMGDTVALRLTTLPLEGESINRLIAAHLGGGEIEPSLIRQLETRTGGNPFAIGEYIRAMLDGGLLRPSWGKWLIDTDGLEKLQLSSDVIQLVVKRVDGLHETTRGVLSAAALIGSRFELEHLPAICNTSEGTVNASIGQAIQERLIERGDAGEFSFVHDRVQEALLARINAQEKRSLHQRIAEELDKTKEQTTEALVAIASHYSSGDIQKNPYRVYEANFAAAKAVKEEYADEEAYRLLSQAASAAEKSGQSPSIEFYEVMGEICARTSRNDEGVKNLLLAIDKTPDMMRRANIRTKIVMVHTANMHTVPGWKEAEKAFEEAGWPWPRFGLFQFFSTLFLFFGALFVRWTGIGFGTVKGAKQERYKALARLYETSMTTSYLQAKPPVFLQCAIRPLFIANRLPPSRERAVVYSNFGVVLGALGAKGLSMFYHKQSLQIANQLGDRELMGRSLLYQAYASHWLGDTVNAESLQIRVQEQYARWMDPNDSIHSCVDLSACLQPRGYFKENTYWMERGLLRAGMADYFFRCYLSSYAALGRPQEAAEHLKASLKSLETSDSNFLRAELSSQYMLYYLEQEDFGEDYEKIVTLRAGLGIPPVGAAYHVKLYYIYAAHCRYVQCVNALPEERPAKLKQFSTSILMANLSITGEVHLKCHMIFLKAGMAWLKNNPKKALKLINDAEQLAYDVDSPWILFECKKLRARMLIEKGNTVAAMREVRSCAALAVQHGWTGRMRRLQRDFGLERNQSGSSTYHPQSSLAISIAPLSMGYSVGGVSNGSTRGDSMSSTASGGSPIHLQRQLDALLEVSLAASTVLDPNAQARVALDEIVRILGAERAYLFLAEENEESLYLKVGRSADGTDIPLEAYSTSVLEQVRATRAPLVFSGNEDGQVAAAESVMAHNLRSIMAAPLMRQDRLVGVVYLDNRLARGVFTENDLQILLGIGNHIAIAMETTRIANLEKERAAYEKDLAVTVAVQSLLLPATNNPETPTASLSAVYRPATQSGGDWWWYETRNDGKLWVLLGDVTGHGVGSAMVTAAVASSYRTLLQNKNYENPGDMLVGLNESFRALCGEAYRMTFSAIEIDPTRGMLRWWSAGAPPLLVLRANGQADVLSTKGTPLGVVAFEAGLLEAPFNAGDRMLVFSDGVTESQTAKGGQFGIRRLRDFFASNQKTPLAELATQLLGILDSSRGSELPQDDDITFVVLEQKRYIAPARVPSTAASRAPVSSATPAPSKAVTAPALLKPPAPPKPLATMAPPPPSIPGTKKT